VGRKWSRPVFSGRIVLCTPCLSWYRGSSQSCFSREPATPPYARAGVRWSLSDNPCSWHQVIVHVAFCAAKWKPNLILTLSANELSHLKHQPTRCDNPVDNPEEQVHWPLTRRGAGGGRAGRPRPPLQRRSPVALTGGGGRVDRRCSVGHRRRRRATRAWRPATARLAAAAQRRVRSGAVGAGRWRPPLRAHVALPVAAGGSGGGGGSAGGGGGYNGSGAFVSIPTCAQPPAAAAGAPSGGRRRAHRGAHPTGTRNATGSRRPRLRRRPRRVRR